LPHIISFDMGGTTAKSSLIKDFHPEVTSSYYVGVMFRPSDELPVVVSSKSQRRRQHCLDRSGRRMKVGPQSAGAAPGPACYGKAAASDSDRAISSPGASIRNISRSGIRLQRDKAAQAIVGKSANRSVYLWRKRLWEF